MEEAVLRRSMHRGRRYLRRSAARWNAKKWHVVQCALAAGVAWFLAANVIGRSDPIFAPIAAVIALGTSYGQRLRRVVEITLGVAIGVLVGDVLVSVWGSGAWQLAVIVFLAMSSALLFNLGPLFINQAAVQAIFVAVLIPGEGGALLRWTDALIGGAVALIAATVVPAAPLRRPRQQAAVVVRKIAQLLRSAAQGILDHRGEEVYEVLEDARSTDGLIRELQAAADEGMAVVASSPFRVRHRDDVRRMADLVEPLDRAMRTTRVFVRQAAVASRLGLDVPPSYASLAIDLADAVDLVAEELASTRDGEEARPALIAVGEASGAVQAAGPATATAMLMQIRSLVADLLVLTGMEEFDAADSVPPPPDEGDPRDSEPDPGPRSDGLGEGEGRGRAP